jgi:hypothetical protein
MGTVITNLVAQPALRSFGFSTKWTATATNYTIGQVSDPTCPEGGSNVAGITNTVVATTGQIMCTISANPFAARAPINSSLRYSASVWVKRVNAEAHPNVRLLLVTHTAAQVAATPSTTFVANVAPPIGVWTKLTATNVAIGAAAAEVGYLGVYPIGTPSAVTGGIYYVSAASLYQRAVHPPAGRFFDGETKTWEPDTVCAWTGVAGQSASTWTSVRDQIGVINTYDGVSELPLTSTLYDGSADSAQTYVESQVV